MNQHTSYSPPSSVRTNDLRSRVTRPRESSEKQRVLQARLAKLVLQVERNLSEYMSMQTKLKTNNNDPGFLHQPPTRTASSELGPGFVAPDGYTVDEERLLLHNQAVEYQSDNPEIGYFDAVTFVASGYAQEKILDMK